MPHGPLPTLRLEGVETSIQRKGLAAKVGWAALAMLLLLAPFVFRQRPPDFLWPLAVVGLLSPHVAIVALVLRLFRWRRPGSIAVTEDRLILERSGHDRSIPRGELVAGHVNPRARTATFELANGNLVHAHVASVDDAQRLLAAIGLDASRRAIRFRLGETFFMDVCALVLGPAFFFVLVARAGAHAPTLAMTLTALLFVALRAFVGPAHLLIGADGIIVRQNGATRFVPFSDVASVDFGRPGGRIGVRQVPASGPITLKLTDGTEVRARTFHLLDERRAEIATRIADARRSFEAGGQGASLAQLDRNGRSASALRAAMGALLGTPDAYRAQPITRDALVEVLECPAALPERRVAAALALAGSEDPEARTRIRVAAGACADPHLRVALEHAADDALDDDDLERAVATRRG